MQIILYSGFTKKKNSTKQPGSGVTSKTLTGTLKEPCSVLSPVVLVKRNANDTVPENYTYAYIAAFSRYYFIKDVTWYNGMWEISLDVDVLASFKTEIGASSHYVLRTDSNTTDYDPMITDTMYPSTNDYQTDHSVLTSSNFVGAVSQGTYVVGIISNDSSSAVGAINYYAMTASEFGALKAALLTDSNLETMDLMSSSTWTNTDMSKELFKTMYNPYQYIASCMWFPFQKSKFTYTTENNIPVGWWTYTSLTGSKIYAQVISLLNEEHTTIPAHPQASTRGDYLNYSPYTKAALFGRFGTLPLDPSYMRAGWRVNISYYIDVITGQARAFISTWDDNALSPQEIVLADRIFSLGVPIQIAQIGVDYLGTAVAAVDTVAGTVSAITRLDAGGAISSAAHGIYNTLQSAMPQMVTSGANGSFLSPFTYTHIQFHHYKIVDEDISHKGRPLCKLKTINTLTGYILCSDGEFDISCMDEERTAISDFLTTGFFWE